VRFLIDAQLPPALAEALRQSGHEAFHLEDVELRHAKDSAVWDYARQNRLILITKDEDFVEKYRRAPESTGLLWLRVGNSSRRKLLEWFMPLLPRLIERLDAGDRLIEVR
jgi:predicted nuclease of predicted toxin-antitoxin system